MPKCQIGKICNLIFLLTSYRIVEIIFLYFCKKIGIPAVKHMATLLRRKHFIFDFFGRLCLVLLIFENKSFLSVGVPPTETYFFNSHLLATVMPMQEASCRFIHSAPKMYKIISFFGIMWNLVSRIRLTHFAH